ncbi:hypothetical protein GY45DRAFT_383489 [Cubamyces sp. BRFM 1775]|nr:hypothetical protein GY45DRAFT_383489 [Cubamyces sp. BRFM 1775]
MAACRRTPLPTLSGSEAILLLVHTLGPAVRCGPSSQALLATNPFANLKGTSRAARIQCVDREMSPKRTVQYARVSNLCLRTGRSLSLASKRSTVRVRTLAPPTRLSGVIFDMFAPPTRRIASSWAWQ